ncbi:arginase family protein [Rhodobacteraceae bacterium NNCM2]|nr:arginase family protein [Coraliihabitans acroporae]
MQKPDLSALFGAERVETFMGIERCDDLDTLRAKVALLGAPCATPYGAVGAYCRNAPAALRAAIAPLASNIDRHNFDVGGALFPEPGVAVDCGDLPYDEADAPGNRRAIRDAVSTIRGRGAVPILLGGDDSIPIPMLEGLEADGPCIILQLDAHIDWRREHMGERLGLSSTMRRASEMAHVEGIIQVGARGTGSAASDDFDDALEWGAAVVTAREFHHSGAASVVDLIPTGANIVLCIDADVLDPAIVPGVIGRTPGGLSYFQVLDLIEGAAQMGRIVAADFVEYVPEFDVDNLGALNVSRLVAATMGLVARQSEGDATG